ncbi:MAG: hypothetical protein A2Y25_06555 [Candidatus Melainabacteria bacterium GWF2_37_15]|nr:MAG: hypothetical protein A2Y25_06555 [Candidatus Melainabacteria bacterium GWF2_37_15]
MTQLSQIGAGRQVAFGANTEKKDTAKKAAIVAVPTAAGIALGATKLAPKVLSKKNITLASIANAVKEGKVKPNQQLAQAAEILSGAYGKIKELPLMPTATLKEQAKKLIVDGRKAAHEALPKAKLKGAALYGAAGAAIGALGILAYNKFAGNKEAAPAQEVEQAPAQEAAKEAQPQQ